MAEKALFLYDDFHRSYAPWEFRYNPNSPAYEIVYRRRPDAPPPPERYEPVPQREFLEAFENGLRAQSRPDGMPEALEEFKRCVDTGPESFRMARAWRAVVADVVEAPEAEAWLREAVAEDPMAVRAACTLGRRVLDAGEGPQARALFEQAAGANPDWGAAWDGLARCAWLQGDFQGALGYAARSLQLWSTNYSSLLIYGGAALELGHPDRAEQAYRRALTVVPESRDARFGLQRAQEMLASGPPAGRGGTPGSR
jgi:tetratricopeptide (TPR) repeat protein